METTRTALVFGATGLTGGQICRLLENDDRYGQVKVFSRSGTGIRHPKFSEIHFDSGQVQQILHKITGDDLFCALGTTLKKAGSREEFYRTDHDLVLEIAEAASKNGVVSFNLVSSIGADVSSANYYLRTKGGLEEDLQKLRFKALNIVRPSIILGKRNESRSLEAVGIVVMKAIAPLLRGRLRRYRPVHAHHIAEALIALAFAGKGLNIVRSDEFMLFTHKTPDS